MKLFRFNKSILFSVAFTLIMPTSLAAIDKANPVVNTDKVFKVGVRALAGIAAAKKRWEKTIHVLNENMRGYRFELVPIQGFREMRGAAKNKKVDFILTNPLEYTEINKRSGLTHLLTLNKKQPNGEASTIFASVIFARADSSDINNINDLHDKNIMAVHEDAFGGWRMAWRELLQNNYDPYEDSRNILFADDITHQSVVYSVLNGHADVGVVRTGVIEQLINTGKIKKNSIKVLNAHNDKLLALHSTQHYPEWPFSVMPHVSSKISNKVFHALLSIRPESLAAVEGNYHSWHAPLDYTEVYNLKNELDLQYVTFAKIWDKHWVTLLLFLLLVLSVIVYTFYLFSINKKLVSSELELSQQKKYLFKTLNSIGDAVISTDDKGNVTNMNPVAENLTGWLSQEAQGQSLKTIFPIINASTREPIKNPVDEVIATGKTIYLSNHTTLISKNGTEYQIADSASPILDNGHMLGVVLVFNDVTANNLKDDQLRRSQKMDALGKLTGGIAHDYNNILGVILGYSELIEEASRDKPELTAYINCIINAGKRGAKLTKKLLNFSRHQSSDNKIVNLNALLESSKLMLEKTLTVRVSLSYELEKNIWSINLDESDLEDAILNISINAMHAIEGNGQINFETRNEAIKEIDTQNLEIPAGDYVLLSITDTGCGMDNKTKENIFDPFYSTKGGLGTGLGLSQVYGFTQRSKGTIKIVSELGHGSQFTLYFPRYYGSDIEEKQFDEGEETNLSGNKVILVVDDEPALAELTSHVLTEQGYHVLIANSAKEALLVLEKESVDVLISDVIMSEMDGYELASIVQDEYPNIKIQLVSGFNDDRHVNHINTSLHDELLHKPYHSKKLLLRVRELLKGSAD